MLPTWMEMVIWIQFLLLEDDTIAWYENNGAADPSFTTANIATSADGAQRVFVADLDSDGDLDIVSGSAFDNTIAWYKNDGAADPTWTATNIDTTAEGAHDVYVADMDGDGDLDIVSASIEDDTIAWYENQIVGDPTFNKAVITDSADGANDIFLADLDGDGDMDILSASELDDTIAWYENDGASNPSWTKRVIATSADGAGSVFAQMMVMEIQTQLLPQLMMTQFGIKMMERMILVLLQLIQQ